MLLNRKKDSMAISEWVSVEERMPEQRKAVLVFIPSRMSTFAAYRKGDKWFEWRLDNGEITHWRPMPEAPVIPACGEWVKDSDGLLVCSECGVVAMQRFFFSLEKQVYDCQIKPTKFCPSCGTKMRMKEE